MKRTAFYYWRVRDWFTGKVRKSSRRIRLEDAACYPGAVKIEEDMEYRADRRDRGGFEQCWRQGGEYVAAEGVQDR